MGDPIPIRPKPAFKVDPKGQQPEWAGEEDVSDLAGRTQTVQQTIYAFTNIAPAEQESVYGAIPHQTSSGDCRMG